jgi:hypothetical protein
MSQAASVGAAATLANSYDLGPGGSLQFRFAKLQLAMAEICKGKAMDYIDQIERSQEQQKQVSTMLNNARQLQADATDKVSTTMPPEMVKYMDDNNLAYDKKGNDKKHLKAEWDLAITALKDHLDQLGTNTQQLMVFVQDFMGQYNSYLQGSNSVVQQSNQTLAELARSR